MENAKPNINVTPLIDVLLVLLIIFMIVSPLKPTDFKAKIPQESKQGGASHPDTIVVALNSDLSLRLNAEDNLGSLEEPQKMIERLSEIFQRRNENQIYADNLKFRNDLPTEEKIQKTVFIKAPRNIDYGKVVKLVDAVKIAGANPISLQIDDLN